MPSIQELNHRRAEASMVVQMLGVANQPTDYDSQLKADARYRLALDASSRAERDYSQALAALSSEELLALAK